jgi:pyrroline-5-carboxylate reductase
MNTIILKNTKKDQWNKEHYTQVKVSVPPAVAADFKSSCVDKDTSIARVIKSFMIEYAGSVRNIHSTLPPVSTRRQRKREVGNLIQSLSRVLDAEEHYIDNIPENLRGAPAYEATENIIDMIGDAICSLEEIYG